MGNLKKILLGNGKHMERQNMIWNVIGSSVYAGASMVLIVLATAILGPEDGGIFSIAFTTGQLMQTIGYFEMRPFQVTDVKNQFQFRDYYTFKIFANILMIAVSIIYVGLKGWFFTEKGVIAFLICVYKMIDCMADVFEAMFQKEGRLDLSGKSMAYRTVLSSFFMIITMIVTRNLYWSCISAIIFAAAGFFIFDFWLAKEFVQVKISVHLKKLKDLGRACLPLFIGSFMYMNIFSAARYAVDDYQGGIYTAFFSIVFLPTSVINLLGGFIFRPLLTTLALSWEHRDFTRFQSIVLKLIVSIAGVTAAALLGSYFLGIPILSFVSGNDLSNYKTELMILVFSGSLGAVMTILYYVLTVMRKMNYILLGYSLSFVASFVLPSYCVNRWGTIGAAWSHCVLIGIMSVCFMLLTFVHYRKVVKNRKYD